MFDRFYCVILGLTWLYWVSMGFIRCYWVFNGFYKVYRVFNGIYFVILGSHEFCMILLDFTWVLHGFTGF